MKLLSYNQCIYLHELCQKETGGSRGFREKGMLESAVSSPLQSFDGSDLYLTIEQKAARLGYGLVKNHAFVDGNKRAGAVAMLTLLSLNGIELKYTQKELSDIILAAASGSKGYEDLLAWVIEHKAYGFPIRN